MTEPLAPLADAELQEMLTRATDGGDHEWGWYVDDVPRLIAELEAQRATTASVVALLDELGHWGHHAHPCTECQIAHMLNPPKDTG